MSGGERAATPAKCSSGTRSEWYNPAGAKTAVRLPGVKIMSTVEIQTAAARLDASSAGISMTPEEFDAITDYDECFNYELINGVLVVTPMSSRSERSPNDLLGYW